MDDSKRQSRRMQNSVCGYEPIVKLHEQVSQILVTTTFAFALLSCIQSENDAAIKITFLRVSEFHSDPSVDSLINFK